MQQRVHNHCAYPRLLKNPLELLPPASPKPSTTRREKALRLILCDTYFSQTVTTLTTGVFLVGLALQLKAPNAVIGLLAAIPALAQLVQMPALLLVEKFRSRRSITLFATMLSRMLLLPMAAVPFLAGQEGDVAILLALFVAHTAAGAVGTCAWNSWLKDMVPTSRLGDFFAQKLGLASLITIVLTLLGGYFIDFWARLFPEGAIFGYSVLFLFGLLFGLAGIPLLRRIPEPKLREDSNGDPACPQSFVAKILAPFKDANYRQLLAFLGSWNFAINLAAPFITVYMLKMLHFPMSLVTVLIILGQVANWLFLKIWGRLSDRLSNKAVLMLCVPLFLACILGWTFTTLPEKHALTMPMVFTLQILVGIATAGVTLANGNIAIKLAPSGKGTSYLAANSVVASLAAGIAPILGGLFADFFTFQELSLNLHWHAPGNAVDIKTLDFHSWDFFFCFAFLLGLGAIFQLNHVQEGAPIQKRVLLQELVHETQRSIEDSSLALGTRRVCIAFGRAMAHEKPPRRDQTAKSLS